jgi:uncharacterized protein DUF6894
MFTNEGIDRITREGGVQIPPFYFNIVWPNCTFVDHTGRELAELEQAHRRAVDLAYQLHFHRTDEPWLIRIEDDMRATREVLVPHRQ